MLFFAGTPISIYGTEIKAFLRVPPQKVGLWVLKARILANQTKLVRWHRIKTEPSYAISLLLAPAAFCFGLLLLYSIETYSMFILPKPENIAYQIELPLVLATFGILFVLIYFIRDFNGALKRPDAVANLQQKIEKLQAGLPTEQPRK